MSWYMLQKLTECGAGSRLPVLSQQVVAIPLLETNSDICSCVKISTIVEILVGMKT